MSFVNGDFTGHLFLETLLVVVIAFLLLQKSYQPEKRPLTEQEIDQLCDEWTPEPLHPPITKEMELSPPVLESAAGPHTVVNGKDVINLSSANYLGLIGHPKIKVPGIGVLNFFSALGFWLLW
jgi:serine palmitoyltransferase